MNARDFDAMERRIVDAARAAGWRGVDLRASVMPRSTHHWIARAAEGWQMTGGVREEHAVGESPEEAVVALLARIAEVRAASAERILDAEVPDTYDADADLTAHAVCTGCQRPTWRHALDTTGRCPTCPAADAHRDIVREGARSLLTLALAILTGAYLTTWDRAVLDERADAARGARR